MPIVVRNPVNDEVIAEIPSSTAKEVHEAIERARAAQPDWAARGVGGRALLLRKFQDELLAAREEVARLATQETGKPMTEALGTEVVNLLEAVKWATTKGVKVLRPEKIRPSNPLFMGRVSYVEHAPLGVVGVVSPWNYPVAIAGGNVVYALLAGNSVVLKPASFAPLTALKIRELMTRAGLPEDVFIVVPGSGAEAGEALVSGDIDHLVFTGSVPVGKAVEHRMRERAVRTCMELGGSDPALVLSDANLSNAVRGIAWARFTNAGQTCAAVKRAYVHEDVYDAFVAKTVEHVGSLRLGDPMDATTDIGPLTDPRAVAEMEGFLEDAKKRGGRVLAGGRARADLGPHYFEPTVVVDLPEDARLLTEECFGPILPIVRFADVDEAIRLANGTPFGLGASVWTANAERGREIARRLQAGTVVVNDAAYTFAANETPWGGVKDSGHGRTHGRWGLYDVTQLRHVNVVPANLPSPWWFPYGASMRDFYHRGAEYLYGKTGARARTAPGVLANLIRRLRR